MIALPKKLKGLEKKLARVANVVAEKKPKLHFLALVHRASSPDGWDLLVSSGKLEPWSLASLKYIDSCLKDVGQLTEDEFVGISQIVALPRSNPVVVQALRQNGHNPTALPKAAHPSDRIDGCVVIWPKMKSGKAA